MNLLERAAVLGAGTMGARIAAHFANAGVPCLLLDLTPEAARNGLDAAARQKPSPFFTPDTAALVETAGFDEGLPRIGACGWILEAVVEDLGVKRALLERVCQHRRPGAIVSTNTSGIPLARIAAGFPEEFNRHFLGTHFFNPPRYLHLLELIPGPATDPALLDQIERFAERRLGKGAVRAKDTPNFIANRIGSFFGATVGALAFDGGWTVEEADALTGPLIGLPSTATFRLLDLIGIDVMVRVNRNLYDGAPHDPCRERFRPHPVLEEMVSRGWLGDKSGQGFYKRVGKEKEIHALDWRGFDYRPAAKAAFPALDMARQIEDLPARLRAIVGGTDRASLFLWSLLSAHILYASSLVPEIADRIVEIDRAMRWGYAHKLGPFEYWDALGFEETARRIEREGRALPESVTRMLAGGARSFYQAADESRHPRTLYFDLTGGAYAPLEERPGVLVLHDWKRAGNVVRRNAGASLIDLGGGVLALEFHSKANALGEDQIGLLNAALDELERDWQALVIGNQGEHFSAGANLVLVLLMAEEGEWDELDLAIRRFQNTSMRIKYAPKPVVAAPHGRTLGGACEIALHANRCQASAELYMGLVEVGAGVIPAAGGCKELLLRLENPQQIFELIGYAKVSTSAADARRLGLLRHGDAITMNPDLLIGDAKALALALTPNYVPGRPRQDVRVGGDSLYATLKMAAWTARQAGHATDYDLLIAEKLAWALSGGRLTGQPEVSEQYLLDLEREAFLSLCGNPKTRDRMRHLLQTGKPLRN